MQEGASVSSSLSDEQTAMDSQSEFQSTSSDTQWAWHPKIFSGQVISPASGGSRILERGVRAPKVAHLGGSGGFPPPENFDILDALRWVLEEFSVLDNLGSRTECPSAEMFSPSTANENVARSD